MCVRSVNGRVIWDGGLGRHFQNLARGLQAIQAGQSAIHNYDAGVQLPRQPDGFFAIACFADHVKIGFIFQHAPEAAPHQSVIIHQQDCDLLFHLTPLSLGEQ